LKNVDGLNDEIAIEIAYDLQSGSYVRGILDDPERWSDYTAELGSVLARHVHSLDTLLDCGTGELTTLFGIARHLPGDCALLAFDISLSRMVAGLYFAARHDAAFAWKVRAFCAPMSAIPLPDKSVDVVLTTHALEPNRGHEETLLAELFRICRRRAVLFEPSYEDNTPEGRERMDRLGYVRDLDRHIVGCGGTIIDRIRLKSSVNPLNPTYCWVVDMPAGSGRESACFRCPITGEPLQAHDGFYWSPEGLYAYPVITRVPVLKARYALVLSAPQLPWSLTDGG
jgi:hypothetical protein